MVQKIQTLFIDDIDGSEAEGTVRFALDGAHYEIDLNASHAAALRKAIGPYAKAGRRTITRSRPGRPAHRHRPTAAPLRQSGNGDGSRHGQVTGSSPLPDPTERPEAPAPVPGIADSQPSAGTAPVGPTTAPDGVNATAVREWAKAQGLEVKDRGRVPAALVVKFRAATGT